MLQLEVVIVCIACVRHAHIGRGEDRGCAVTHGELVDDQAIDLHGQRQREIVGWLGRAAAFAIRKRNCEAAHAQLHQVRLFAHHELPRRPIQCNIVHVDHQAFVRVMHVRDADRANQ